MVWYGWASIHTLGCILGISVSLLLDWDHDTDISNGINLRVLHTWSGAIDLGCAWPGQLEEADMLQGVFIAWRLIVWDILFPCPLLFLGFRVIIQ